MAGVLKFTDEELKEALIRANGKPVKAAELLDADYTTVYVRVRANPELQAVQKAARAKTFNECNDMLIFLGKTGFIQRSVIGEDGKVTAKVELVPVDERTRIDTLHRLANTFKADDGIVDEVNVNANVTATGSISIDKWLERNSEADKEPETE